MNKSIGHPSFEHLRSAHVGSLDIELHEFRHPATGAMHYHIAADNPENVFLVGLRTVPEDSTGVAHILEHTVLCGSERYPVRDPFFMMIRRSLNTFMNAFTSSDWTAYPFATQNRKDYFNLLDVYLDAVFFSRLDELDFMQEGHRVEFETADDPATDLVYKGVVFNEMKGAMSSPSSLLWQTLSKHLFADNTYHYNSGGDPEVIPELTWHQLREFYDTHYHPSNAVFMTYGDMDPGELQERFQERVLSRFEALDRTVAVKPALRYHAPVRVEEAYAVSDEDVEGKTHVVVGWLLGESVDLDSRLRAHLLSSVLLDNSASPLMQALEKSDLGSSPSPLCGLEDGSLEMVFVCGARGLGARAGRGRRVDDRRDARARGRGGHSDGAHRGGAAPARALAARDPRRRHAVRPAARAVGAVDRDAARRHARRDRSRPRARAACARTPARPTSCSAWSGSCCSTTRTA